MKTRLKNHEKLYGSFLSNTGWGGYIEILKHHGYDFVLIEAEHAPLSYAKMEELLRTARLADIHPVIRVSSLEYTLIAKAMDMGGISIMVPHIESAEQAQEIVNWAKYPPVGERGAGGYKLLFEPDKQKYVNNANEDGIIIVQIESRKGIEQLDHILQVPNIDAILIGPFDLSVDLGCAGQTNHPSVVAAIETIIQKCQAKNMPIGIHLSNVQELKEWSKRGVTLLSFGSDIQALFTTAQKNIELVKGTDKGKPN